jgi:Na+-driven multidrug efflux pump
MAAGVTGAIGVLAALFPHAWLGLFTRDPDVLAAGTRYLRIVGPCYGFFGAGLALYFAAQGAGRLLWPLLAGFTRLVVAATGGWIATRGLGGGLPGLFAAMAAALVIFGAINVAAVGLGAWRTPDRRTA